MTQDVDGRFSIAASTIVRCSVALMSQVKVQNNAPLPVVRTASNLVKMPQNFGSSAKVLRKPPPALSVSDAPLDARSARQLRSMFSRLVDAMALSGIPDSLFPE
jgi:hypothetical protein